MIKIPNESQKGLQSLLKIRERIETFQTPNELNTYLSNIDRKSIKERNINTIFSNLKNNMIFKYGDERIKKNIKDILFEGNPLKILTKGEVFKLYLYLYEGELGNKKIQDLIGKYSKDNLEITKESFVEFIIKESKNLYTEWNFPIEIKIKYKIFEDVVAKLKEPEVFKKLSPIMLELARYIDMTILSRDLKEAIKKEMLDGLPKAARDFFKKYSKVEFEKAERIDNIIFIFLKDKNIVSLTIKKDKNIKIELLDKNRYNRMIENEIETSSQRLKEKTSVYEIKNFRELAKKLRELGHEIKWIEIDTIPKVIGISLGIVVLFVGLAVLYYYFRFKLNK